MNPLPAYDDLTSRAFGHLRHRSLLATLMATVVGVLLIAAGLTIATTSTTGAVVQTSDSGSTVAATDTTTTTEATTTAATTATAAVALTGATDLIDASDIGDAVVPSVVTIQISDTFRNREVAVGSGSGIIWDGDGHIVTNAHVVEAGESYEVVIADGRVYQAELVGFDETTDVAVLRIEADDLTPVAIGSTETLAAGDPAVAIGSPLGLDGGPSLTVGVISALGRTVEIDSATTLYGMIQADAPITEGSSGGALVNEAGELIGITSAVGVSTVGVEGIGFSTPVEIVERVVDEILAGGRATQPIIGIAGSTGFATMADGGEQPIGVEVEQVAADSAAASAGIEVGDVIAAIDGIEVNTMEALISEIRTHSAGDTITLTLAGDSVETTVGVTLGDG